LACFHFRIKWNTCILQQITNDPNELQRLEDHFHDQLLIIAADVPLLQPYAQELRLTINTEEFAAVLDHLAGHAGWTIEPF